MEEYKWLCGKPADKLADELEKSLHGDSLDRIREVVFYVYRGDMHNPMLFMLADTLNNKMSIHSYARLRDGIIQLCEYLRKMKK